MKITTLLLASLLAIIPITARSQSNPPEPKAVALFQLVVGGVIAVVGGVAIYTIYKTARAAENAKCSKCGQLIPVGANTCPGCGKAFACKTCGTKLPPDAVNCPRCFTKVPEPKKPLTALQVSSDGTNWTTVSSFDPVKYVFADDLAAMQFKDQAEFDAWSVTQTNIVAITPIEAPRDRAFFRLASE